MATDLAPPQGDSDRLSENLAKIEALMRSEHTPSEEFRFPALDQN